LLQLTSVNVHHWNTLKFTACLVGVMMANSRTFGKENSFFPRSELAAVKCHLPDAVGQTTDFSPCGQHFFAA